MSGEHTKEDYQAILQQLRDPQNDTKLAQDIYTTWAAHYDKDVTSHDAYRAPQETAAELASRLGNNTDARILDLGAGTGLVAMELTKLGFTNIDALDPSRDMLNVAKGKGLYKQLIEAYLGPERLDIQDGTYDALVSAGTFVPNHADETCFEELIRITKPGGLITFMVSCTYAELLSRIDERINRLQEEVHWRLINPADFRSAVGDKTDGTPIQGKMFVLQKTQTNSSS